MNLVNKVANHEVIVIGAGPSGLAAAHNLVKRGVPTKVFEKAEIVGGIARTESYRGFHFDMGGHRFFTKSKAVNDFWNEVLAEKFLERDRLSRIYYRNRFFSYPLKPLNAFFGLGLIESVLILLSYLKWQVFPYREEDTFEQWVTNRFGKRLFKTFFKTYTEKVWGISCTELKAEWAAQRIKGLSLASAVMHMFRKPDKTIKTLIDRFHYPCQGPGMMWRAVAEQVENSNGEVHMKSDVVRIHHADGRVTALVIEQEGVESVHEASDFISSMPLTEVIKKLDPPPPDRVLAAADELKYRDFLTVCLIVNHRDLFEDNWIYIHDPSVKVGRIQNFGNWSPDMVPNGMQSSLGLEYFCNEGDELWCMPDAKLVELGKREIDKLGLAEFDDIDDGCVFRVEKSYPVYDSDYQTHLKILREYLETFGNFQTIGRNGLHRYNNQDHAMLTGMLAVKNLMDGENHDLWSVNAEQEYHEELEIDESETEYSDHSPHATCAS